MALLPSVVSFGILFPQSVLSSSFFAVLSAFVAINTVMYVALALAKALPKVYLSDWISWSNTRSQTRSIHPDQGTGSPATRGPTK